MKKSSEDGNHGYQYLVKAEPIADLLDVSTRTIRAWQTEGRIPYIRITAATTRYDVAEVMAALEAKRVAARKPQA